MNRRSGWNYESRDVHYRALAAVAAGLVILVVFAAGLNAALFAYFQQRESERETSTSPFRTVERRLPSPLLAIEPSRDRLEMEAEMEELLGGYGWVDPAGNRIRIPIERAMEILAAPEGDPTGAGGGGDPQ